MIAVQGPTARGRLAAVAPDAAAVARFARGAASTWGGATCVAAGTGYTGEDGVECAVPAARRAPASGRRVLDAGVAPAGLGARDTLRLEAGLPLHGHELGPGITPAAGRPGLGGGLGQGRLPRPGRRCERERAAGPRPPPAGPRHRGPPAAARRGDRAGRRRPRSGAVTSGNFSPVLGRGIALAFVDTAAGVAEGDEVEVEVARPAPRRRAWCRLPVRGAEPEASADERLHAPHRRRVAAMLGFLGLSSLDELFAAVPDGAAPGRRAWTSPPGCPSPTSSPTWRTWPPPTGPCGRDLVCFAGGGRLRPRGPGRHPGPGRRARSS